LTILTPGDAFDPARPDYVQEITETLAIVGFDTRPVETDFDTVVDLAFTAGDDGALHYDMYLLGWTLGNPALPAFYRPLFSAEGRLNNTGYASDVFDRALAAYEGAFTVEEASTALWAMEQTLAADLPYLSLYTSQLTEIYRSDRVAFDVETGLGGLQARLGGIADVRPVD
jgi:ABC-type transport system substrate-binding protein